MVTINSLIKYLSILFLMLNCNNSLNKDIKNNFESFPDNFITNPLITISKKILFH